MTASALAWGRRTLLARIVGTVSLLPGIEVGHGSDGETDEESEGENDVYEEDPGDGGTWDQREPNEQREDTAEASPSTAAIRDEGRRDDTAVVDRIVNGSAVVLFEASERRRTVPATVLPSAAREEGVVLHVPEGEALALAEVDRAATRERRASARDRFDELAERPGGRSKTRSQRPS